MIDPTPNPPRLAAFLRGINLGNRRVKGDRLQRPLQELGLRNVETFLASGNVVFDAPDLDVRGLETQIESALEGALGFPVATLVRTLAELKDLAELDVIESRTTDGFNTHVIFLRVPPGTEAERALHALETTDDRFHVHERDVLWFRRGGLSDSVIETRHLERALNRADHTIRNLNTVRRMLARFGP